MKSCLNCTQSGFIIEKNDDFYSYEGDCNQDEFPLPKLVEVWQCQKDDRDELKEEIDKVFEQIATKCKNYEATT